MSNSEGFDSDSTSSSSSGGSAMSGFADWRTGSRRPRRSTKAGKGAARGKAKPRSASKRRNRGGDGPRADRQRRRGSDEDSAEGADVATDASSDASDASSLTLSAPEEDDDLGGNAPACLLEYSKRVPAELQSAHTMALRGMVEEAEAVAQAELAADAKFHDRAMMAGGSADSKGSAGSKKSAATAGSKGSGGKSAGILSAVAVATASAVRGAVAAGSAAVAAVSRTSADSGDDGEVSEGGRAGGRARVGRRESQDGADDGADDGPSPAWFYASLEELERRLFPPGPALADVFFEPNSLNCLARLPIDVEAMLPVAPTKPQLAPRGRGALPSKPSTKAAKPRPGGADSRPSDGEGSGSAGGSGSAAGAAAGEGPSPGALRIRPDRRQFQRDHRYYRRPDWRVRGGAVVDVNHPEEAAARRRSRRHAMPLITRVTFDLDRAELVRVLSEFSGPYGPVAEVEAAVAFPDCPCDVLAERLDVKVRQMVAYRSRKRDGQLVWGPLPQEVTAGLAEKRELQAWMADQEEKEAAGGGCLPGFAGKTDVRKRWEAEKRRRQKVRAHARRQAVQEVREKIRQAKAEAKANGIDPRAAVAAALAGADLDNMGELDIGDMDVSLQCEPCFGASCVLVLAALLGLRSSPFRFAMI